MKSKRMQGNLMLLLTAFIWGTAFVAQKSGMDYVGPFTFNGIRTLIGALVLTPVIASLKRAKAAQGEMAAESTGLSEEESKRPLLLGGLCCGIILFIAGSLQQVALQYTAAGKAGFITALYIVLVPVLGIFLRQKVRPAIWACVAASAVGLFLLCVPAGESFSTIGKGEILLFISAIFFAVHILVIDHFVQNADGVQLSQMQFLVCGLLSVPLIFWEAPSLASILACWFPIFYTGVLSVGVAYTLQVVAQKNTDPTSASLILSLESVFSVLAGAAILSERMSIRELFGCLLMFAAIIVSQLPQKETEK